MILVIAEQRDGVLNRASWEAIAAAQQAGVTPVKVAVLGEDVSAVAGELAAAEVAEVLAVESPALASYTADGYTAAVAALAGSEAPAWLFAAHTYQVRDFFPRVAARLDRALISDCIAVHPGERLTFSRPMFQARLVATVAPNGPGPHLATFQIGAYRADTVKKGAQPAPVRQVPAAVDAASIRQQPEPPFQEAKQSVDLSRAERIVAVGRGIKGEEHIALARELAEALGAELAASRPICDAGWLPMDRQVGSSGQTVAPKLYLALGISGAIQHVVGMKGARTIVAINKDPEAPIFEIADYGIAGDLFEVVPAIIAELKK
ncbi:MAG TPA: electron transfer flavoprotein subunit alpha/FixB family protein [Vicinamibacterales bacterium]